jgi:drug/metabolite transporter (DMT)-like permease
MKGDRGSLGKTSALTILAPLAWGTTYVTITQLLPPARPLLTALMRVGPAGILLLGVGTLRSRWRPHGSEWWHTTLLALGWIVLGQSLSPVQLAGFVITISAIVYGAKIGSRPTSVRALGS